MNKYGEPLVTPSKQGVLPVMHSDGRLIGFIPIATKTYTGSETSHTTSDGAVLPLTTVTVDHNAHLRTVEQYVAAVYFPNYSIKTEPFTDGSGLYGHGRSEVYEFHAKTHEPWASVDLVPYDPTAYSWWVMPTQTWMHRFGSVYTGALRDNLDIHIVPTPAPAPPDGTDNSQEWAASLDYLALFGDCAFFDFNWMTVFKTKNTNGNDPLRIQVVSNPAPVAPSTQPPLVAKVIGIPNATSNGPVYDSIRILKLDDHLKPKAYVFKFKIIDTKDQVTNVTFTLTVK